MTGVPRYKPTANGHYWCNQCARWLLPREFGHRRDAPCGLHSECKTCANERKRLDRVKEKRRIADLEEDAASVDARIAEAIGNFVRNSRGGRL